MLHEYFTQLLAILFGEALVVLVRFPLALVIKRRTDNHSPTRNGRETQRQSSIQSFLDLKAS